MKYPEEKPRRLDVSDTTIGEAGIWYRDLWGNRVEVKLTNYELVDLITPFANRDMDDLDGSYVEQVKWEIKDVFDGIAVSDSY